MDCAVRFRPSPPEILESIRFFSLPTNLLVVIRLQSFNITHHTHDGSSRLDASSLIRLEKHDDVLLHREHMLALPLDFHVLVVGISFETRVLPSKQELTQTREVPERIV